MSDWTTSVTLPSFSSKIIGVFQLLTLHKYVNNYVASDVVKDTILKPRPRPEPSRPRPRPGPSRPWPRHGPSRPWPRPGAWTFEAKAVGPEAKAIKMGLKAPRGQGLASTTTSLYVASWQNITHNDSCVWPKLSNITQFTYFKPLILFTSE